MIESGAGWPKSTYVLIPAYKSADTLRPFLPELLEAVPAANICVVDDGSFDGTDTLCSTLGLLYQNHHKNRGKGAALATGLNFLLDKGAKAVITLDADNQHSPEDLPKFLDSYAVNSNAGIIIGCRKIKCGHMPVSRIFSNRVTSCILSWMTGTTIPDSQCGYRLYSEKFLRSITITCPRFEMESEVIIKAAFLDFPILFVEVQTLYLNGQSHISNLADTFRWITAVIKLWLALKNKEKRRT
jgi:glycosyltransferase involved in cell wall biosynthesis